MNKKIMEHYKLIYKVINNLKANRGNEIQNEYFFYGLMGLYNGIKTYDKTKGFKESTYYYNCIKNEIMKYWVYKTRNKRDIQKNEVSINTPISETHTIEDTLISDVDIEEDLIKKEQLELIYKTINEHKSTKFKQYICEFYGINQSPKKIKEIALKHGVAAHNVSASIKQGIKIIRKKVEKEYYEKDT